MARDQIRYLSAADRSRLRPTIDIDALERFFAATPRGFHRFFFLACVITLSDAERQELGLEASIRGITGPDSHYAPSSYHYSVGGLLNAALRAKWEEVEPSQYRGA
jgi:hypothetical protein